MNKYSHVLGIALAALTTLLFTGCSFFSDKLAEKEIESLSGGDVKVNIDSDKGTSTITGKDGSTITTGGGDSRPKSAPEDLPNLPNASNFSWVNISGSGMLGYEILNDNDYVKACADQLALLTKAGWTKSDSYEMDVDKYMTRSMEKPGFALTVTCADSTEDGSSEKKTGITLNTAKSN